MKILFYVVGGLLVAICFFLCWWMTLLAYILGESFGQLAFDKPVPRHSSEGFGIFVIIAMMIVSCNPDVFAIFCFVSVWSWINHYLVVLDREAVIRKLYGLPDDYKVTYNR